MAYSQHDKGSYLFVIEQGFRDVYNVRTHSFFTYSSPNTFSSISTSPYHDEQVLIDNNLKIQKWSQNGYMETFYDYAMLGSAKYSFDGNYIFSIYLSNQLLIWDDTEAVEMVDGWTCSITDISSNRGILSVVDSCGELGILKSEDYFEIPVWIVLIISIVVILLVCGFIGFLIRKNRMARQMQTGGYQHQNQVVIVQ